MKKIGKTLERYRFLLLVIPFLVLLLPFIGKVWSMRFWDAAILLTQCPFIAVGHSVRQDESASGFFTIGLVIGFFLLADRFSNITYAMRDSTFACLGVLAILIVVEIAAIELIGWALSKSGQKPS